MAGPCSSLRVLLDVPSLGKLFWAPITMPGCHSPLLGSENPLCITRHSSATLPSLGLFTSLCLSLDGKVEIAGTKLALHTYQHYPGLGTQEVLNALLSMNERKEGFGEQDVVR